MDLFRPFKQRKPARTLNYLSLTPKAILTHETGPNGLVVLHVPRFSGKGWPKFIKNAYANRPILLNLDELGSATWTLIDGKRTVGQIIHELEQSFGTRLLQADERVTRFLSHLYRDHFISFCEIS